MPITKADIDDLSVVSPDELSSDGYEVYKSGVTVVSTTSATKRVVISGFSLVRNYDCPTEPTDFIDITGNDAAGRYTIAEIVDENTLVVIEAIVDAGAGLADFVFPPGASRAGFDPTGLTNVTAHDVQGAIVEIDGAITSGGITAEAHKTLRQLIHLADGGGPMEGFTSGAYRETLPLADPFPTSIIWWESNAKLKKIVEKAITYNANKTPATIVWKAYDATGALLVTLTDTISYSSVFETSRTRTWA